MTETTEDLQARRDAAARKRQKAYPDFFAIARYQRAGDIDFSANDGESDDEDGLDVEKLIEELPLGNSNSVSSKIKNEPFAPAGWHLPVLDFDFNVWASESSTPGHYHVILDKPMSWEKYKKLLEVMADCGLLEQGFLNASIEREASWVRTPWTDKYEGTIY